jgi:hypothetical protein
MPEKENSSPEIKLESEQLAYLKSIDKRLYRLTSMRWLFVMGLVRGVSSVIGATIIAAIVFALLSMLISSFGQVPLLDQFIEDTGIEELLSNR